MVDDYGTKDPGGEEYFGEPTPDDSGLPPTMRGLDDIPAIRKNVADRVVKAISSFKPVTWGQYTLSVSNVKVGKTPDIGYQEQKRAILGQGTLGIPVRGTWTLSDGTGKVLDKANRLMASIPVLTDRGTYIRRGIEYTIANQARLRPGVFVHKKGNGELEAHFNTETGSGKQFRVKFEPESGRFLVNVGQANLPVVPLLKVLGADDAMLKKSMGDELYKANADKVRSDSIAKTLKAFGIHRKPEDTRPDEELLTETLAKYKYDPEAVRRGMLGKPYDKLSAPAILDAMKGIVKLHRGEVDPDNRDSLRFQRVHGPEDLLSERIEKDSGKIIRSLFFKVARRGNLDALPPGVFNKHMDQVFMGSGMSQPPEETNPTEVLDQMLRVVRLGEGAIPNIDSVPDEARNVQASYMGWIDPIRTPECYSADTEVFTKSGWLPWPAATADTEFACRVDGRLSFQRADRVVSYDYDGVMYGVRTGKPSSAHGIVDFLVTPEHRIWTRPYDITELEWRFETAEEHYNSYGRKYLCDHAPMDAPVVPSFTLPTLVNGSNSQVTIPAINMDDWAEFMGWYLSEGSFHIDRVTPQYQVKVSQSRDANPDKYLQILDLMGRLPFKSCSDPRGFTVGVKQLAEYVSQFGKSDDKYIPEYFFDCHVSARERLLDSLLKGDGRWCDAETYTFISVSRRLRDDVGRLAISLGYPVSYGIEKDKREHVTSTNYTVRLCTHRERVALRHQHFKERYSGKVYCATVPGGLLFVRRRGSHGIWMGNSGKVGVDNRFTHGVMKGSDGQIYTKMRNVRTGKTEVISSDHAGDSIVALPGELTGKSNMVAAVVNGQLQRVPRAKVDYEVPNAQQMFTAQTNLMPMTSAISGGRIWLGAKFVSQALPLTSREAPMVRAANPDGGSFEDSVGRSIGTVRTDTPGTVKSVDDNSITLETPAGIKKISLANYVPYNRKTYLKHNVRVKPGDVVKAGDMLATSNMTDDKGTLALGTNLNIAYVPFSRGGGNNYEDAIILSETGAKRLRAEQMYMSKLGHGDGEIDKAKHVSIFPGVFTNEQLAKIGDNGMAKPGTLLHYGDPVILATRARDPKKVGMLAATSHNRYADATVTWEHETPGFVTDSAMGPKGAIVATKVETPMHVGDKMAGRFGDKHIVSAIVPDAQMPVDGEGRPFHAVANPLGIISRVNPAQLVEAAYGRIAQKTGKPIDIPSFITGDYAEQAITALRMAGLKPTEEIWDPVLNRKIQGITTGNRFYMRLHHMAEDKLSGRSEGGSYTSEGAPAKGGGESSPRFGLMEINALLSAGATEVLNDAHNTRGHRNEDYWRAVRMGYAPPPPKAPDMLNKFLGLLAGAGVNMQQKGSRLNIMAMRDQDVDTLAHGEITSAETVKFPSLDPIEGGLFDRGITGGHGGNRFGKIELGMKIPNPVMEEPVRRLLGLTESGLRDVLAGKTQLNQKSGPDAIEDALSKINIPMEMASTLQRIRTSKKTPRDAAIKKLRILEMLDRTKLKPTDMMISKMAVLPPAHRPISMMDDVPLVNGANMLYKDLLTARDNYKSMAGELGPDLVGEDRLAVYDAVKAVVGLGDPINKETQARHVQGLLRTIFGDSPKLGLLQRKMMGTTVNLGGRAVITPDPRLDMDHVGLPEEIAWRVFQPFVTQRLVTHGATPMAAARSIKARDDLAKKALLMEMAKRPVMVNRAPSLHRESILGAWAVLSPSNSLRLSPVVTKSFNADFDGDQQRNKVLAVMSDSAHNADISRNAEEIPMAAYFKQQIVGLNDDDHLVLIDLEDFPHDATTCVTRDHIDFYAVPKGIRVVAVDEASGGLVVAAVSGWSVHHDRKVEIVTLSSGKQIITDDDPRAVYGVDGDTLQWCRRRPKDAYKQFVPVVDRDDTLPVSRTQLTLPKGNNLKPAVDLDEQFGHLIGLLAGDGWATGPSGDMRSVNLAASYPEVAARFKTDLTSCFTRIPLITVSDPVEGKFENSKGCPRYTVSRVTFAKLVHGWIGSGAANKHLPPFSFSAPRQFKLGVLAGLFDSDGSISESKGKTKLQWMINFSSTSLRLVQEVQYLLRTLNVNSTVTAATTPAGAKCWVLNISTPDFHQLQHLDVSQEKKRERFNRFFDGPSPSKTGAYSRFRLIPLPACLKAAFQQLLSHKTNKALYFTISEGGRKGHVSCESARRLLAHFAQSGIVCEHPLFPAWKTLASQTALHFERVVNVEVTGRPETGHDLTVPGYETFTSVDGVVLSNTMAIHVPGTDKAVRDVIEKLMPSKILIGSKSFNASFVPRQEFQLGLFEATKPSTKKTVRVFAKLADAVGAFRRGEINVDDVIDVPGTTPRSTMVADIVGGLLT